MGAGTVTDSAPGGGPEAVPSSADLVVVGAGLMGSATAWAAIRRGLSVVLLDQFRIGHHRGSSHGSARIVRRAYADPLYTRLTGRAFELWRELELDTGTSLVRITGGLDHGRARDTSVIAGVLADQGIPHEILAAGEAEQRWPGMAFVTDVLFHPQAGTVDAAAAVEAAVSRAGELGAAVFPETAARQLWTNDDGTAMVTTDRGEIRAPRVVVAAGAWAATVLAGTDIALPELTVTQQQVFHFARRSGTPEWPIAICDDALSTYSLPGGRDGGPGGARKVAEHFAAANPATTAEHRSGVVDPAARARIVDHVRRWLPGLDPDPFAESTCLYTSTASEDFVLDRVGPVVVCSPCSGHGAKFAPLIGELVVEVVTGVSAEGAPARIEPRFSLAAHDGTGAVADLAAR